MYDTTWTPGTYDSTDDPRIREGYRIVVEQDNDAEDPRTWGPHVTTGDETHQQWAAGDVVIVTVEHREIYVNARDASNQRVLWDDVWSTGSVYLKSDYTAVNKVAEDYPDAIWD